MQSLQMYSSFLRGNLLLIGVFLFLGNLPGQEGAITNNFEKDSFLAIEYFNIADTSFNDVDRCKRFTQLAIPLLKRTGQHEKYVYSLACLSYCYNKKEQFDSLEINNVYAVEEAKKYLPADHSVTVAVINNLAFMNSRSRQDHRQALDLYLDALNRINNDNASYGIKGTVLNNIGNEYRHLGDFDNAILYHKEALQRFLFLHEDYLKRNVNINSKFVEIYAALANLSEFKGDYTTAAQYLEESLALLNENPKLFDPGLFVYTYIQLAEVLIKQKKLPAAQSNLAKAASYPERTPLQRAKIEWANANVFFQQEKYGQALSALEKGLNILPPQQSHDRALMLHFKGKIERAQREYESALRSIDEAIALLAPDWMSVELKEESGPIISRLDLIHVLHTKAIILRERSEADEHIPSLNAALQIYQQISDLSDQIRQNYQTEESKLFLNETAYALYEDAMGVCFDLYQKTQDEKYKVQAFYFTEKSKATSLLDELMGKAATGTMALPDSVKKAEYQLRAELNYLDKQLQLAKTDEEAAKWNTRLLEARRRHTVLRQLIETNYPNFHRLLAKPEIVTIAKIQESLLKPQQVLIEFFKGKSQTYAFVVMEESSAFYRLENIENLDEQIAQLLEDTKMMDQKGTFRALSYSLYEQLLKPLELPVSTTHLLIVPDGTLAFLPFELLTNESSKSYNPKQLAFLLKQYNIAYAYSATVLWNQSQTKLQAANLLAVAPVFEGQAGRFLRYSEEELRSFKRLHKNELLREQANKAQFLNQWSDFQILHIASHATASDEALHQPAIEFWDEQLYLTDLYTYNATPQMVVLSACETGIGDLHQGEGVLSLARGFTYAGAASVVTTLWKVNDRSTAIIMAHFYEFLEDGLPKDEALRQAKLTYLGNCTDEMAAPYYWASFVQLGDNRSLQFKVNSNWWIWALAGLLPVGLFLAWRRPWQS